MQFVVCQWKQLVEPAPVAITPGAQHRCNFRGTCSLVTPKSFFFPNTLEVVVTSCEFTPLEHKHVHLPLSKISPSVVSYFEKKILACSSSARSRYSLSLRCIAMPIN